MRVEAVLLSAILISSIYSSTAYGQTPTISITQLSIASTQDLIEAVYAITTSNLKSGDWLEIWLYPPSGQSFSSDDLSRINISSFGSNLPLEKLDSSGTSVLVAKIPIKLSSDYVGGNISQTINIVMSSGVPSGTYKISAVIMPDFKASADANIDVNLDSKVAQTPSTPTPVGPKIVVTVVQATPKKVTSNQVVTIVVTVTNKGDAGDHKSITYHIKGTTTGTGGYTLDYAADTGWVAPGETKTVTPNYVFRPTIAGSFIVTVDGVSDTFTVVTPEETEPSDDTTKTQKTEPLVGGSKIIVDVIYFVPRKDIKYGDSVTVHAIAKNVGGVTSEDDIDGTGIVTYENQAMQKWSLEPQHVRIKAGGEQDLYWHGLLVSSPGLWDVTVGGASNSFFAKESNWKPTPPTEAKPKITPDIGKPEDLPKGSVMKMFLDMFGGESLLEGGINTIEPNEKSREEAADKIESVLDDISLSEFGGKKQPEIEESLHELLDAPQVCADCDPCEEVENKQSQIEETFDDLSLDIPSISVSTVKSNIKLSIEEIQELTEKQDILQKAADEAKKRADDAKKQLDDLRKKVQEKEKKLKSEKNDAELTQDFIWGAEREFEKSHDPKVLREKQRLELELDEEWDDIHGLERELDEIYDELGDAYDEVQESQNEADAAQKAADEINKTLSENVDSVLDDLGRTIEDAFKSDPNAPKIEKTLDNLKDLNEKLQEELKKCEENMKMERIQDTIGSSLQQQITDYADDQNWQNFAANLKQFARPDSKSDYGVTFYPGDVEGIFSFSDNKIIMQNTALDLKDKANLLGAKKESIGDSAFDKIQLKYADKIDKRSLENFKTIKGQLDVDIVNSLDRGSYYGEQPKSSMPQSKYYSLVISGDATRKSDFKSDKLSGTILLSTMYDDENNLKFNVVGGELTMYDVKNVKVDENLDVAFGKARILENGKLQLVVNTVGLDGKQNTISLITNFDGVPRELGDSVDIPKVKGQISGVWDLDAGAVLAPDLTIPDSELDDVRGDVILDDLEEDVYDEYYIGNDQTQQVEEEYAPAKVFGYIGIWDTNPATMLTGYTVKLRDGAGERTTQTDKSGKYKFENVVPGKVLVSISIPAGKYAPSGGFHAFEAEPGGRYMKSFNLFEKTSNQVSVLAEEKTAPAKVFGYVAVWSTTPATPVVGLTVTLRDGAGERTTQTGENGKYTFENVVPGKVLVSISVPAGKYAPSGGFHAFEAEPGVSYMKSFNLFEKSGEQY